MKYMCIHASGTNTRKFTTERNISNAFYQNKRIAHREILQVPMVCNSSN